MVSRHVIYTYKSGGDEPQVEMMFRKGEHGNTNVGKYEIFR